MMRCFLSWQIFMSIRLALLGKRIHIIGSAYHLQQQSVQDKIRACLLAGISLCRFVASSRWQQMAAVISS